MKKKMLGILVLALSSLFLVACTNNSLDGEYYWINDGRNELEMTIKGNGGSIHSDGSDFAITNVDSDNKQITVSTDFGEKTFNIKLNKDGKGYSPNNHVVYKKGTKACDEALKKYGYKEAGKE
ncbi:hypothetical protein ASN88_01019 [Streptococcus parauberis]|uniref:hypothetical protein n=1 Tax=Streptococcus parauberis TaxID=1348 RepID=UPI000CCF8E3A|nr:hypothetical protein [Streptococcus parauberis]PNY21685.1 hypothetical protein ASN88_01019 [Streptococcus parauberis]HEN0625057.1 hypothetical protein [Streptococcus agalactiae]